MADNPLAPVSRLAQRLAHDAKAIGLRLVTFHVAPNTDPNGPHTVQAIFTELPDDERPEPKIDLSAFEGEMGETGDRDEEAAAKLRAELTELEEDLRRPDGGIGLD